MDKFYIGQRVRIKMDARTRYPEYLGRVCTIDGPSRYDSGGFKRWPLDFCRPDGLQAVVREIRLEPVHDGDSFERFMERVRKPVPLDKPVVA